MDVEEYAIHGEVDYQSTANKIANEFENILEALRETYSNSVDAGAETIRIFPLVLPQASALVVVDDGCGMDREPLSEAQRRGCNGSAKSCLDSYFHIGHSTKVRGQEIGQFCMGANLAIMQADVFFVLVTRTERMPAGMYHVVVQQRMDAAFRDRGQSILTHLLTFEDAETRVQEALAALDDRTLAHAWEKWFASALRLLRARETGTLQAFVSKETPLHKSRLLDVDQPSWSAPKKGGCRMISHEMHATSLYTYLRFQTRHGSFLQFPRGARCTLRQQEMYREVYRRDMRQPNLLIHCAKEPDGLVVPYGFPYIEYASKEPEACDKIKPNAQQPEKCKTPYWARMGPVEFTRTTEDGPVPIAVYLTMDSANAKNEQYEGLDRVAHKRGGVSALKMQGIVVTCHGTYVTTIRGDLATQLIEALPTAEESHRSRLQDIVRESFLAWNARKKLMNLMVVIDGVFQLKTDRNNITPAELNRLLTDQHFTVGLANALQDFYEDAGPDGNNLRNMLEYMFQTAKAFDEKNAAAYAATRIKQTLAQGTVRIVPRPDASAVLRALLASVTEAYAAPGEGYEHQLVFLYGLYGATVRTINQYARDHPELVQVGPRFRTLCDAFWMRPGLLFGRGVDVQVFDWEQAHDHVYFGGQNTEASQNMKQLEFKVKLQSTFNHPFVACDMIVVNETTHELVSVTDSMQNVAKVLHPPTHDALYGLGFYLTNIRHGMTSVMHRVDRNRALEIPVINFQKLLVATLESVATVEVGGGFDVGSRARPPSSTRRGKEPPQTRKRKNPESTTSVSNGE